MRSHPKIVLIPPTCEHVVRLARRISTLLECVETGERDAAITMQEAREVLIRLQARPVRRLFEQMVQDRTGESLRTHSLKDVDIRLILSLVLLVAVPEVFQSDGEMLLRWHLARMPQRVAKPPVMSDAGEECAPA